MRVSHPIVRNTNFDPGAQRRSRRDEAEDALDRSAERGNVNAASTFARRACQSAAVPGLLQGVGPAQVYLCPVPTAVRTRGHNRKSTCHGCLCSL